MPPSITQIERITFEYPLKHVSKGPEGFNLMYEPGNTYYREVSGIRIHTDIGITGEFVGGTPPAMAQLDLFAESLIGENPLKRELHWSRLKRGLRKYDRMGIGPVDIALWDFAGKHAELPIHELLGSYREELPAYASTYFGSPDGGFDSPDTYADFAESCRELGYSAYKLHIWTGIENRDIKQEVEIIDTVGERVGDDMELMHDPVCEYETFADALTVGRACDRQDFFWYEDPYSDGGSSQHAHRQLRQRLETPLLQTELVRGLEAHTDFVANEATDFVRADPEWDSGITGAIKIARMAEGFGLDVEYHLAGPAVRHCMAATRNSNYYEVGLVHPESPTPHTQPPIYEGDYTDRIDAISDDGTFPVPSSPGLGVVYDWDYIEENAVDVETYE